MTAVTTTLFYPGFCSSPQPVIFQLQLTQKKQKWNPAIPFWKFKWLSWHFLWGRIDWSSRSYPCFPFQANSPFFMNTHMSLKELIVSDWDDLVRTECCPPKYLHWGRTFDSTSGQAHAPHGMEVHHSKNHFSPDWKTWNFQRKETKWGKKEKEKENTFLSHLLLLCANQVATTYTIPFLLPPISK